MRFGSIPAFLVLVVGILGSLSASAEPSARFRAAGALELPNPLLHRVQDDGDDIGACYRTLKWGGMTLCDVVERRFCIGNIFLQVTFEHGEACPEKSPEEAAAKRRAWNTEYARQQQERRNSVASSTPHGQADADWSRAIDVMGGSAGGSSPGPRPAPPTATNDVCTPGPSYSAARCECKIRPNQSWCARYR